MTWNSPRARLASKSVANLSEGSWVFSLKEILWEGYCYQWLAITQTLWLFNLYKTSLRRGMYVLQSSYVYVLCIKESLQGVLKRKIINMHLTNMKQYQEMPLENCAYIWPFDSQYRHFNVFVLVRHQWQKSFIKPCLYTITYIHAVYCRWSCVQNVCFCVVIIRQTRKCFLWGLGASRIILG